MNIYIYEYTCICIAWQYKLIDITNMLFAIQNHSANISMRRNVPFLLGGGLHKLESFLFDFTLHRYNLKTQNSPFGISATLLNKCDSSSEVA